MRFLLNSKLPSTKDYTNPPSIDELPYKSNTWYVPGTIFVYKDGLKISVKVWWDLDSLFGLYPYQDGYGNHPKEFVWVAYPLVKNQYGQIEKKRDYHTHLAICQIEGVKVFDIVPKDILNLVKNDESYPCMQKDLLKERLKLAKALFSDLPSIDDSMWEGMSDENKDLVAHLIATSSFA